MLTRFCQSDLSIPCLSMNSKDTILKGGGKEIQVYFKQYSSIIGYDRHSFDLKIEAFGHPNRDSIVHLYRYDMNAYDVDLMNNYSSFLSRNILFRIAIFDSSKNGLQVLPNIKMRILEALVDGDCNH